MGGLPVYHVDAFTDRPFAGNPAAVCLLPDIARPTDAWMQAIAGEMNLSETAFVQRRDGAFSLRWFTPVKEVDLCGHATLASAHVLWETGHLAKSTAAEFDTLSGRLTCRRVGDSIQMDFPAEPARPVDAPPGLFQALGCKPSPVLRNRLDYMVVLPDEASLRALRPLTAAPALQDPARGFIVTTPGNGPHDYACRYFAPAYGIPEDPVTGSIQCALGPYWAQRLGKTEVRGLQASARTGTFVVRPQGERVAILGMAVTTSEGRLTDVASRAGVDEGWAAPRAGTR